MGTFEDFPRRDRRGRLMDSLYHLNARSQMAGENDKGGKRLECQCEWGQVGSLACDFGFCCV